MIKLSRIICQNCGSHLASVGEDGGIVLEKATRDHSVEIEQVWGSSDEKHFDNRGICHHKQHPVAGDKHWTLKCQCQHKVEVTDYAEPYERGF